MSFCASCSKVLVGSTKYLKRTSNGFFCPDCQLQDRLSSILSDHGEDEINNQSQHNSNEVEQEK